MRPTLKQFGELTEDDFAQHPIWIAVHTADYDEPWYDDTDEETFRPWLGTVPVDPSDGMFLVSAEFQLQNGVRLSGFLTPAFPDGSLGTVQPQIFAAGTVHMFWFGMRPPPPEAKEALYAALGASADEVFPIRYAAYEHLCQVPTSGSIVGFVHSPDFTTISIET